MKAGENQVCCMSYNIHAGVGIDGVLDLDRIADVIRSSGADIVGLNEVDCYTKRSHEVDQAGYLAGKLGFHCIYGKTMDYNDGQYGNAMISRFPVLLVKNHRIPEPGFKVMEPRGILECSVDVRGKAYTVYVTHFGLLPEEQIEAVNYLRKELERKEGPIILMGDFNLVQENQFHELKPLLSVLKDTAEELGTASTLKTFESAEPKIKIDYIMISKGMKVASVDAIISQASDHLPLIAAMSCDK